MDGEVTSRLGSISDYLATFFDFSICLFYVWIV